MDANDGSPLSDVEFLVTTSDGTLVGNANGKYVTDSTGTILIETLLEVYSPLEESWPPAASTTFPSA